MLCMLGLGAVGCGAASGPEPTSSPSARPSPVEVSVPSDGVTLEELGFQNGPAVFSVPRSSVLTTTVDQDRTVTLVIGEPSPEAMAQYLRIALPVTGFTIDQDETADDSSTLTFSGFGWSGVFTGAAQTSAVTLRR